MVFGHEVVFNKKLNDKFNLLRFKSKNSNFVFKIGQYTIVKVKDNVFRCYSIISTPEDLPYWEIFVDVTPGGPGTTYLKSLVSGQSIETLSASGHFEINNKLKNYVFGATGCGIAPFLPMLRILSNKKENRIYLFWGLRNEKDITLLDLFESYSNKNNNIHYEIVLSKPDSGWKGRTGHVTKYVLEMANKLPIEKTGIFLSGSNKFVDEVDSLLAKNNFPNEMVFKESCY